jgi:hypothetical protein
MATSLPPTKTRTGLSPHSCETQEKSKALDSNAIRAKMNVPAEEQNNEIF